MIKDNILSFNIVSYLSKNVSYHLVVAAVATVAVVFRSMMEPAKTCIRRLQISCAKSVGCGFVRPSKSVPVIRETAIQLSYLKLYSYKQTSSK